MLINNNISILMNNNITIWSICIYLLVNDCRQPLPDHYSVTLEILRERSTKATMETCTQERYDRGDCPVDVYVGDEFVDQTLSEPCLKMVSTPLHTCFCRVNTDAFLYQWRASVLIYLTIVRLVLIQVFIFEYFSCISFCITSWLKTFLSVSTNDSFLNVDAWN